MESIHYPDLQNMVESEGVCPICLMEIGQIPKYQCENGHTMCHRCKPYYYGCSICDGNLNYVQPLEVESMYGRPPPIHFMPHPMSRNMRMPMPTPSAPDFDFIENERRSWGPPPPEPNQNLVRCRHSVYGCWIRVPEFLRDLHETRCQFRPFLEVEHLPTDLPLGDELIPCAHSVVGCNVMMPSWRQGIHEPLCIFKERFEAFNQGEPEPEPEVEEGEEDPDELVECKLKIYGCLVKMPRRRKLIHEEKCNYIKYFNPEDFEEPEPEPEPEEEDDPESQVDCCWAEHGCQIRPKLCRKEIHQAKCNYKMEECSYKDNGCEETFLRARKFVHERDCEFKSN